jgi:hypothetical protein
MWGTPKDVEGECNSHLYISDDYGDNRATMRCRLPKGHGGAHREEFPRASGQVVVTWEKDEREAEEKEREASRKRMDRLRKKWEREHEAKETEENAKHWRRLTEA